MGSLKNTHYRNVNCNVLLFVLTLQGGGAGCPGHNQHLFNVIQSVTHNLAHIYHSMSDLACDFSPQSNRELTAAAAPAPPPTAIIHQNIPITIPLRVSTV